MQIAASGWMSDDFFSKTAGSIHGAQPSPASWGPVTSYMFSILTRSCDAGRGLCLAVTRPVVTHTQPGCANVMRGMLTDSTGDSSLWEAADWCQAAISAITAFRRPQICARLLFSAMCVEKCRNRTPF